MFEADTFVPEDEGGTRHRAARRGGGARARHDHRRVLRELDRSAAPGARRLGQGGATSSSRSRRSASRRSASSPTRRRTTRASTRSGSTSTSPSASRSSARSIRRAICRGCSAPLGQGLDLDASHHRRQRRRSLVQAPQGARHLARRLRQRSGAVDDGDDDLRRRHARPSCSTRRSRKQSVEWPSVGDATARCSSRSRCISRSTSSPPTPASGRTRSSRRRARSWARPRRSSRATSSRSRRSRSSRCRTFPFDRYPQVDVQLRYDDPQHGIRQDDLVRITKEQPNAQLAAVPRRRAGGSDHGEADLPRRRPSRPRHRRSCRSTQPQVDVADPFPQRLKVTRRAGAQLQRSRSRLRRPPYDDEENDVHVEDSIEIVAGPAGPAVRRRARQSAARRACATGSPF